jgi:hypothetical protein
MPAIRLRILELPGRPFLQQKHIGVNEEQGRGFSCREGCVTSVFPVAAAAESEA